MDLDEPIMYRVQCVKCNIFLSMPFKLTAESMEVKDQIKIPRYKGDNLNYHENEDLNNSGKILYYFIFCLSCHEKVGYWMSQASKREEKNLNKIFLFRKCINLIRYSKNSVSEEEDRRFKQEEAFYNSEYLTDEVINYAKEHIDNFINNLKKLEEQRTEARHCYDSIDRDILYLKDLFVKIMQGEIKEQIKLDFNSSKEKISDSKIRNRLRIKNYERNKNEQEEDSKSVGRKVNKNEEETLQNGQNIINNEKVNNSIINQDDNNDDDKKEGDNKDFDKLSNNLKSDIHIDEKIKQNNIEQIGQNIINNEEINNNIINQDENNDDKKGGDNEVFDNLSNNLKSDIHIDEKQNSNYNPPYPGNDIRLLNQAINYGLKERSKINKTYYTHQTQEQKDKRKKINNDLHLWRQKKAVKIKKKSRPKTNNKGKSHEKNKINKNK